MDDKKIIAAILTVAQNLGQKTNRVDDLFGVYRKFVTELEKDDAFSGVPEAKKSLLDAVTQQRQDKKAG